MGVSLLYISLHVCHLLMWTFCPSHAFMIIILLFVVFILPVKSTIQKLTVTVHEIALQLYLL